MEKLDLAKLFKTYYSAGKAPALIGMEHAKYISISGIGDPNEQPFADKVKSLYAIAYTIKFMHKAIKQDFVVAKLEALWDLNAFTPRTHWKYRLLIRIPDYIQQESLLTAIEEVIAKKQLPLAKTIELYTMREKDVVQMMHTGPFSSEPKVIQQLHAYIEKKGLQKTGLHHEIYLTDFRSTPPEKLKTILRQPVK
ncbi:GyrI-like domain-containing protein [Pedobacter sp. PAMC26386]|nr:GyrI-like domain-containing protein [Pedobacter sp. PAMC26386]